MEGSRLQLTGRADGGQVLILSLNANTTELNGTKFICRVTTSAGKVISETVAIIVKGKKVLIYKFWIISVQTKKTSYYYFIQR